MDLRQAETAFRRTRKRLAYQGRRVAEAATDRAYQREERRQRRATRDMEGALWTLEQWGLSEAD